MESSIKQNMINAIRILSIDQIQSANSGHPGAPLGASPMVFEVFKHMNFDVKNPNWMGRDRFVLSAGHASAMLYSLLHLYGYDLSLDELKNFRQMGSKTQGHPDYGIVPGVECTTGPLGAGLSMAVGMAVAQRHLGGVFNSDEFSPLDGNIFVYAGDGCMMEGITSEASSFAGTQALDKLIVLYDSNNITIDGRTDITFTENVKKRYEAYGWQTLEVNDGNDTEEISKQIEAAKNEKNKPSLIIVKTKIGYGCEALMDTPKVHGAPLGEENVLATRKNLGWRCETSFEVPEEIYSEYKKLADEKSKVAKDWEEKLKKYLDANIELKTKWNEYFETSDEEIAKKLEVIIEKSDKADATRNSSHKVMQKIKDIMPNFIGGSADLAGSNKTILNDAGVLDKNTPEGRNINYGVRELAMTAIGNGIALYGGLKTFIATFFVFSDYTKPMLRLSSIMGVPLISVFSHDSIGVGEDGRTHQPVEQLDILRAMPNFNAFRPADYYETACAWYIALRSKNTPSAIITTRQNLPQLEGSNKEAFNGGYVIYEKSSNIDGVLMASGSEVSTAIEAAKLLEKDAINVRVVSMPCMDIFDKQSEEYKNSIIPKDNNKRLAIEATSALSWYKYIGGSGKIISMNDFGESAPANELFEKYGFTAENIAKTFKSL